MAGKIADRGFHLFGINGLAVQCAAAGRKHPFHGLQPFPVSPA
jgi:hypothetical protein